MKETTKFALIIIAAVLLFVAALILIPALHKKQPADGAASIRDSILYHAKQAQIHHDSAKFHNEESDKAWKKYNAVYTAAQWDSLRARYISDFKSRTQPGHAGLGDSLRAAQTGSH